MESLWQIEETRFDPTQKTIHSQETVFTIGNGYFGTRGSFEEGYPHATPATLLFGVFDSVPIAKEELANTPDWTVIQLFVNGERFRLDTGTILTYQRNLQLQNGVLQRTVHWESPSGMRIHVTTERFASLADEHTGIIRYSVTSDAAQDQQTIEVSLRASINTAQGNYNLMHFETLNQGHDQNIVWLQSETKQTHVQLCQTMTFSTNAPGYQKTLIDSDIAPAIHLTGTLAPGTTLTAEKIVTMYTSRDTDLPLQTTLEHHQRLLEGNTQHTNYEQLLTQNKQAWQQFWEQADILIEGDKQAQIGVRYSIYQLRISASIHDNRYSVAAKGLTGSGYRGHIFHDTEVFMLPFYTYVLPDIARNLLLYRYHLLPAAREKATHNGYEGAQYPWESTLNGEEVTPTSIIHPETGEVVPVLNGFIELHITASIAYAVWEYWRVTGDDAFIKDYGAEILLSTALFWSSRAEKQTELDSYEITNVIGPDEWHEYVHNNAHTNYMARHNIRIALDTLNWLRTTAPERAHALEQQLHLTKQQLAQMHEVQAKLHIPQNSHTGLFEQFEGFFQLRPLDQTQYAGRKDSYQGILGVEEVQHYQIIKQADVLMMMTMMNQDFDQNTRQINWNYYFPITDHDYGSSLTPALHAIIACELGHVEEAHKLLLKGVLVDLENSRGNTPEGIHLACAGAVWQAIVSGFAGLRVTEQGYTTRPVYPQNWQRIAFRFQNKGETVQIDLRRD
ncbi:MAG TPA: hypothetical protein VL461_13885 [Dictyobacter sp.]|nr:hypothetical protein [Dictyobacter sp.]